MAKGERWETQLYKMITEQNRKMLKSRALANVGIVRSLNPLTVRFREIDFSVENDTLYCNELLLDENINLDVDGAMAGQQNIQGMAPQPWIAQGSPNADYIATISGTIPDFIKEFYNYFKQWHNRFILHVGDLVAVQKIGENKIIVLSKISMVVKTEGEGTNGNE